MPRLRSSLLLALALAWLAPRAWAQGADVPPPVAALLRDARGAALTELEGFRLTGARVDASLRLFFRALDGPDAGADVEIRLEARDDARRALVRTASFNLGYVRVGGVAVDEARAVALTRALAARIAPHDPGGLTPFAPATPAGTPHVGQGHVDTRASDPLGYALVWVTRALLLAWLLALALTLRALATLGAADRVARRGAWAIVAASLAGVVVRLWAPDRLVMHYMGYEMAAFALDLGQATKYGPASFALYHEVFRWAGSDHAWLILTNRVLGATLAPLGALLLARLGADRAACVAGAWLVALTPLLVKDASTESILVPMQAWLLLGTAEALRHRATGSRTALLGAFAGLALAALARPEALLLVPASAGALVALGPRAAAGGDPRRTRTTRAWRAAALGLGLTLLATRALDLRARMDVERALGNTRQVFEWSTWTWAKALLGEGLVTRDALLWPGLVPPALTGLALLAPLAAPRGLRLRAAALLGAGLAFIVLSRIDLPYLSIPRVQAPGVLLACLAAALGVAGLATRAAPWPPVRRRLAGALLVSLLAAGAWGTLPDLWRTSHADEEEALIREAQRRLPEGPLVIHRRGHGDAPGEAVHLQFPDYLFEGRARVEDLTALRVRPPRPDGPRHLAVLGTRCFLRACDQAGEHPACAAVRARYRLLPLVEREVPPQGLIVPHTFGGGRPRDASMQGDLDFPWCRPRAGFRIGVYEVLP